MTLYVNKYMVVCPDFGHPAVTSSFTKYKFLQVKDSFNIVPAFEMVLIIFVACLQHLQIS